MASVVRGVVVRRPVRSAVAWAGLSYRGVSSASPTAVLMLNMGGPSSLDGEKDGVQTFLTNLFQDPEIIPLGRFQESLGAFVGKRRAPKVAAQYAQIGGKSPIRDWTDLQGWEMVRKLEKMYPKGGPFKAYTTFRYAPPLTEEVLKQMADDGVKRAIAFSQYPHFSCTTSGSSFNHLWRTVDRLGMQDTFKWSVIDRWPTHPTYIDAIVARIHLGLQNLPEDQRGDAVLLFTAHSLPLKVVARGDYYPHEIAATVRAVVERMGGTHPHTLSWQSKVGFLPWLAPSTSDAIAGLGRQGHRNVLAIPIAFTSDHIETLYEIDIEYAEEAHKAGITNFVRAPSLNDEPLLSTAQAQIVAEHLKTDEVASPQYKLACPGCVNPMCRTIRNPVRPHARKGSLPASE